MLKLKKEGILIQRSTHSFEESGVCNPAVIKIDNSVHIFYRALQTGQPSSIGYCILNGPLHILERKERPFMITESEKESAGIEDPRIVKIEDTFFLTYTAYDGYSALGSLKTSNDLIHFKSHGILAPEFSFDKFKFLLSLSDLSAERYLPFHNLVVKKGEEDILWDKNLVFFPRKIHDKFYLLHRICPDIQLVSFNHLSELTTNFWEHYMMDLESHTLLCSYYEHESDYIGGGCPPIETPAGWILIYHGVREGKEGKIYSACASLLDLENPSIEIARLPYPLFSPDKDWEKNGFVNNVVFPTGTALFGDTLFIYYGAADQCIACASVSLPDLTEELCKYPAPPKSFKTTK